MPPKKDKPKPEGWNLNFIEFILILLLFSALLGALLKIFKGSFSAGQITFFGSDLFGLLNFAGWANFFRAHSLLLKILGFSLATISAVSAFVLTQMANAISLAQKASLFSTGTTGSLTNLATEVATVGSKNEASESLINNGLVENDKINKWQKIVKLSESLHSSDWRLAIIEADIMLAELLNKLQLPGDTIGEKLKAVEKSDFITIDFAWEAHKFRNQIAHQGSDFLINQREIRRIIALYSAVFREFFVI